MKLSHIFLFITSFLLISCYDNIDNSTDREITAQPEIKISTEIAGLVKNTDGTILNNYVIRVGSNSQNVTGSYFHMNLNGVNKYGQAIEVYQNELLIGFLHTNLVENDLNAIEIERFHVLESAVLDLNVDNELELDQSISITLPIGSSDNSPIVEYGLVNMDKLLTSAYTQKHQLLKPINPKVFFIHQEMVQLSQRTFDNPIQINIENGDEDQSLFRFDIATGEWVEVTNLMNGQISIDMIYQGLFAIADRHFGITVSGTVSNAGAAKISYQNLELTENGSQEYFQSTRKGNWVVVAKELTDYELNILNPCNNRIDDTSFSSEMTDLENLDLIVENGNYFSQAEGSMIDCVGESIPLGVIQIYDESIITSVYTNTLEQNLVISVCTETFDISGFDLVTGNQGPSIPWDINQSMDYLSTCHDHLNGYSFLKIRNDKKVYDAFLVSEVDGVVTLESEDGNLKLIIEGTNIGNYEDGEVNIKIEDESFGITGYAMSCENPDFECGITECQMSHYKTGEDEWVRVIISGELWMQTINPPQAGFFEVKGSILTKF